MLQSLPLLLLAVIGGITSVSGALLGGILFALPSLTPNTQIFGLEMAKLQFLWVGIAAVTIGRNPNGVAYIISERRAEAPRADPTRLRRDPRPVGADGARCEEVTEVAPASG